MPSSSIKDRIIEYFTKPPQFHSALYFTAKYIAGIHLSPKDKQVRNYFLLPLEEGAIEPSFTKTNINDMPSIEEKLKEGIEKLQLSEKKTACLIPELSLKAFVLSFDSLPSSMEEKQEIIRYRIKRQMGFYPEDARLSFQEIESDREKKLLVSLAKDSVIQEYEGCLNRQGLRVRALGSPVLGLYNVLNGQEEDFLLINVEKESLSLVAVVNSEISLYRQKPFALDTQPEPSTAHQVDNIMTEVDNTAHFLEDTEKTEIRTLYVRLGFLSAVEKMYARLEEQLPFSLKRIDLSQVERLNVKEREILSPLVGQIL